MRFEIDIFTPEGLMKKAYNAISSADITAALLTPPAIGTTTPAAGKFTTLEATGAVVFNDAGADIDLRAEGDTDTELFSLDASQDSVGVGVLVPSASAKLEVKSTTKGFLTPRMTTAQRTAVSSPAEGLYVHDTDLKRPYFYINSGWLTPAAFQIAPYTAFSGAATYLINPINQFGRVLRCYWYIRSAAAGGGDTLRVQFGGSSLDSTAGNYQAYENITYGTTPSFSANENNGGSAYIVVPSGAVGASAPSNHTAVVEMIIHHYSVAAAQKLVTWRAYRRISTGSGVQSIAMGGSMWLNTSNAVERIQLDLSSGANFASGSGYMMEAA